MNTNKTDWWTTAWNPIEGCTPVSFGCRRCWARKMLIRLGKNPNLHLCPERLEKPLHWKKPRVVFVGSLGDLFHKDVPERYVYQVMAMIEDCPQHQFLILTKRPERMRRILHSERLPDNLWLGVSVEDQATADERIPHLVNTPAAHHFVSVEPMLNRVDLHLCPRDCPRNDPDESFPVACVPCSSGRHWCSLGEGQNCFDWVICGGESGPGSEPCSEGWVKRVRFDCRHSQIPFWFKQWGGWPKNKAGHMIDGMEHLEAPQKIREILTPFAEAAV